MALDSRFRGNDENYLTARSFFYRMLAAFYRHPLTEGNQERIDECEKNGKDALHLLGSEFEQALSPLLAVLFEKLNGTNVSERASAFDRCFGHTANAAVPVYELEYGEEHSHREPQELGDISAFYQAFGLRV